MKSVLIIEDEAVIRRVLTRVLERAGYELSAVAMLATSSEVDLHLAIELLAAGCSEELALKILL